MKKKLLTGLLLSFVFCQMLTGCGQSDDDFEDGEFSEEAPELDADDIDVADSLDEDFNSTISYEDFDYETQVQFLAEHSDWLSFNDNAQYAFCDMDNNGRIDVIVCETNEDGEANPPKFYEISSDYQSLEECTYETNCYQYDIANSECQGAYINSSTGAISYLMCCETEDDTHAMYNYYELLLKNGAVSQYAVCGENPDGYFNSRFEIIDPDVFNFDDEIIQYFEGYSPEFVPGFFFDPLEGDGFHEKIINSILSFTGKAE